MQAYKKKRKHGNLIIIAVIIIFLYIIYFLFSNVTKLNNITIKEDSGYSGGVAVVSSNNTTNILVVYKSKNNGFTVNTYNALLTVTPGTSTTLMALPSNVNFYTSPSSSQTLRTIYPIGNLNVPKDGMNLLLKVIRYNLAIPVGGYISLSSTSLKGTKNISIVSSVSTNIGGVSVSNGVNTLTSNQAINILSSKSDTFNNLYIKNLIFQGILSNILSPLSLINTSSDIGYIQTIFRSNIEGQNIFNLLYAIYNLKIQNIKLLEYKASGLINLKNIDTFIRSNFTGTTFAKSGVSVQILDSSSSNNAVYQFSRYIQNLGGTISSIGIYNQALVKDEIYVGNYSRYKYEVTQIIDILGPSNVTLIKHNPSFYTGDIIVILGSDDNILYSTL
ncbi:MAG: hypothetical protein ACYDAS_03650 [Patescibacteria group bacterium]